LAVSLGAGLRGTIVALMGALGCSPFLDSPDADIAHEGAWEPGVLYLKADPPIAGAWFGYSLVWGGNALAITAPREDILDGSRTITRGGAVYLFEPRPREGLWAQTRLQIPGVDSGDGVVPPQPGEQETIFSAIHVALDDQLVIVGVASEDSASVLDPFDNSMPDAGGLFIFDRPRLGDEARYMKAPVPTPNAGFGYSLALSDEWLIVGAPGDDRGLNGELAPETGAVYAYPRHGDGFDAPQYLKARNAGAGDRFGAAVALGPGLLVIGAPAEDSGSTELEAAMIDESAAENGAAYVYRLLGGKWTFESYLKSGTGQSLEGFGFTLSLSGNALAVGSPGAWSCPAASKVDFRRGAALVFREQDGIWKPEQCLKPDNDDVLPAFGYDVGLRSDQLIVGAYLDSSATEPKPIRDVPDDHAGGAYLFSRTVEGWRAGELLLSRRRHFKAPNANASDFFGTGVAFVPGYVAVGAVGEAGGQSGESADPRDNTRAGSGAVYLFPTEPQ
jgi:hypothetical protein